MHIEAPIVDALPTTPNPLWLRVWNKSGRTQMVGAAVHEQTTIRGPIPGNSLQSATSGASSQAQAPERCFSTPSGCGLTMWARSSIIFPWGRGFNGDANSIRAVASWPLRAGWSTTLGACFHRYLAQSLPLRGRTNERWDICRSKRSRPQGDADRLPLFASVYPAHLCLRFVAGCTRRVRQPAQMEYQAQRFAVPALLVGIVRSRLGGSAGADRLSGARQLCGAPGAQRSAGDPGHDRRGGHRLGGLQCVAEGEQV